MKNIAFIAVLTGLSACEFYYYDPYSNPVSRLTGRYSVSEYSETYNAWYNYTIWIEPTGYNTQEVRVDNFYDAGMRVYATVSYNKITIWRQTVNGYTVEGTGTVYGDEISFTYSVRDNRTNSRTDFCEATAWRD
ncbi:MAG: hypothetical protein HRU69_08325 [Flammeovirgaceae bacterium]|nr:MAG: hypothetical protein HRU69_08325 [Flammeovirgaceae bacterium]